VALCIKQFGPPDFRSGSFSSEAIGAGGQSMSAVPQLRLNLRTAANSTRCANSRPSASQRINPVPASLDDHICGDQKRVGDDETERLSGFDIDHQLILERLLYWQIRGLLTLEDAIDI
jgi:hypothetical protein